MAKLTVKPSEEIVARANEEITCMDTRGRTFTLRKPSILAQFRLIEMLGDTAKNEVFMGMAMPFLFVAAIDGGIVSQPASRRELDALIQRVDEDGLAALAVAIQDHFGLTDPEADKLALKK